MDIDFGDTKSTTGYGYVLTLDEGALSWKYVKKLLFCHDLLCKHKLFLFSMHYDIQIIIFKVSTKNVNEKLIYENDKQIFRNLITQGIISIDFVSSQILYICLWKGWCIINNKYLSRRGEWD